MTKKKDRRVQRTHTALREALMALVVEKGYHAITIQDITDRANVARTTFYLHFRDKDELLTKSLRDMFEEMVQTVPTKSWQEDLGVDAVGLDPTTSLDFDHIEKYADFYRIMLGREGSATFISDMMDFLQQLTDRAIIEPIMTADVKPKFPQELILKMAVYGNLGAYRWWLENDLPVSAQDMAEWTFKILGFGFVNAMNIASEQ